MIRKVVQYTGRVQGVGFRDNARQLARRYEVVGYVQNLDDGRVRLEAQGPADQVHGLLQAIDQTMAGNITDQQVNERPIDPSWIKSSDEQRFEVRYR